MYICIKKYPQMLGICKTNIAKPEEDHLGMIPPVLTFTHHNSRARVRSQTEKPDIDLTGLGIFCHAGAGRNHLCKWICIKPNSQKDVLIVYSMQNAHYISVQKLRLPTKHMVMFRVPNPKSW